MKNPLNFKVEFPDKYYVYMLKDENNVPFYVGKGKGKRINSHFFNYHLKKDTYKNRKIKKIGVENVRRDILCYFNKESDALAMEEWLISSYGLVKEGGFLYQFIKSPTDYHPSYSDVASKSSQLKTTKDVEDKVLKAYKMYFEQGESNHYISEVLGVKFSTLRSWMNGSKHKHLYSKYITSGIVDMKYPIRTDFKLDQRLSAIKLKEMRVRWVNGEDISVLSKEINYSKDKLRMIFLGDSCKGLFLDYSEMPKHLKLRRERKYGKRSESFREDLQ